jgi:transcriptional regulator with XRE-family HTH domain
MPEVDAATRRLHAQIGATVRQTRLDRRWTQRRLARASGCHHSVIARIERGAVPNLSLRMAGRVLRSLGIEPELRLIAPRTETPPVRDRAHARCVATVARRLSREGYKVASEVEVGRGRWRAFIDVLAFHPVRRLLLVCEVKTELRDIGEVDRQLNSYVDSSWAAASSLQWRPRASTGVILLLATSETDRRLQEHRTYLARAFPLRARALADVVLGSSGVVPERGARGIAMIDPASRRKSWLLATVIDGRRTPAPYADRAAFVGGGRSP